MLVLTSWLFLPWGSFLCFEGVHTKSREEAHGAHNIIALGSPMSILHVALLSTIWTAAHPAVDAVDDTNPASPNKYSTARIPRGLVYFGISITQELYHQQYI